MFAGVAHNAEFVKGVWVEQEGRRPIARASTTGRVACAGAALAAPPQARLSTGESGTEARRFGGGAGAGGRRLLAFDSE